MVMGVSVHFNIPRANDCNGRLGFPLAVEHFSDGFDRSFEHDMEFLERFITLAAFLSLSTISVTERNS
jgi:hypothetical protein